MGTDSMLYIQILADVRSQYSPMLCLFDVHARRITPKPFPHIQHVSLAFIRSLSQVLTSLWQLVRVVLETFQW